MAQPYGGRSSQFTRDVSYPRRLSKNDLDALNKGLLTAVGMAALKKNDALHDQHQKDTQDIAHLDQQMTDLSTQLSALSARYATLKGLYSSASEDASDVAIEMEIDEWMDTGSPEKG